MLTIYSLYEMLSHHYINRKKVTKVSNMSEGKRLVILATGKSANEYWDCLSFQKKFINDDILVMNRSIYKMKDQIFKMRPKYLAICDPIYWGSINGAAVNQNLASETYKKTKEALEEVDWKCFLITSIHENFDFNNYNIQIIRINATTYDAKSKLDYYLYKYNFGSPIIQNVAQMAIYFGITFGYKEIALIGIDFDFIKNLFCDKNCRVGLTAEHQYDVQGEAIVTAYFTKERKGEINNSVLAKYLYDTAETIGCFGQLSIYAQKQGCRIVNYSLNSLIDCYEKKSLKDKED